MRLLIGIFGIGRQDHCPSIPDCCGGYKNMQPRSNFSTVSHNAATVTYIDS